MFVVKCMQNGNEVSSITVDGSKEVTAGRGDDCDLKILSTVVSKQHLVFQYISDLDTMFVKNQGRNPTRILIGNVKLMKNRWCSLEDGDVISFGFNKSKPNMPRTELKIMKYNEVNEGQDEWNVTSSLLDSDSPLLSELVGYCGKIEYQ